MASEITFVDFVLEQIKNSGRKFIGNVVEATPYEGAKPSFLIEDKIEDSEWLSTDEIITSRFGTSNLVSFYVTRQFRSPTTRLPRALTETKLPRPKSRGYYFVGTK